MQGTWVPMICRQFYIIGLARIYHVHAHKAFVTRWLWHMDLATDATKSCGSTQ